MERGTCALPHPETDYANRIFPMKKILSGLLTLAFSAAVFSQPANLDLYLLIGQSNMAGRGIPEGPDLLPHPRVWMLNQTGKWVPAVEPIHFDKPKVIGTGPGFAFGRAMADAYPDRQIGLIPCAVGGSSIDAWVPGAEHTQTQSHPYDDMVKRVRAAVKKGTLKGIIWHQGEADCNPEKIDGYAAKLDALIAGLRREFQAPDLPFVVGELGEYRVETKGPLTLEFNRRLHDLPDRVPHTAVAGAFGLQHKGDDTHLDSPSARQLGRRYAVQMMRLQSPPPAEFLIRSDDMGFSHASNTANLKLIKTGLPFSISVIFAGPWYQEAVEMLKEQPQVSVGVHLCLNAEWKNYRWGPVAGRNAVPSLVDSLGYFRAEVMSQWKDLAKPEEIEIEFRAQIERAIATGLRIDYVDNHMGAGLYTEAHRAIVEKLAAEYRLGISGYFGEQRAGGGLSNIAYPQQLDTLISQLEGMVSGKPYLQVFHLAELTPEVEVLYHNGTAPYMAWQRQNELLILSDPRFHAALETQGVRPLTYRELIAREGLGVMRRP